MNLLVRTKDLEHIKEKSSYNHNYYTCSNNVVNSKTEILEICHEDYEFYEYHLIDVDNGTKVFLGCSYDGINDKNEIRIDFRLFYT